MDWSSIQIRPKWSTARTPTARATIPRFDSTSSAIHFGRGWRIAGGLYALSFLPAASRKALKAIRQAIRGWSLLTRSDKALNDLARMFNLYIRGWINCYSHFYKSALYSTLLRIDAHLLRWV
ncbi:group II intron maturase-specific domain-containing protein [Bradyrhizobium australiense]|uniref:group II intron maturase-specific domain-containing protein n=1 Tax=Bradyrhizobium australiense TaxID=2721161 RepID=UPI00289D7520|nr:group II intron maturase-specific domain-containing protein [Bradyrhizobium australiense]